MVQDEAQRRYEFCKRLKGKPLIWKRVDFSNKTVFTCASCTKTVRGGSKTIFGHGATPYNAYLNWYQHVTQSLEGV